MGGQGIKKPKFDEVTMVYPKGYTGEFFYLFFLEIPVRIVFLYPYLYLCRAVSTYLSLSLYLLWTGQKGAKKKKKRIHNPSYIFSRK